MSHSTVNLIPLLLAQLEAAKSSENEGNSLPVCADLEDNEDFGNCIRSSATNFSSVALLERRKKKGHATQAQQAFSVSVMLCFFGFLLYSFDARLSCMCLLI